MELRYREKIESCQLSFFVAKKSSDTYQLVDLLAIPIITCCSLLNAEYLNFCFRVLKGCKVWQVLGVSRETS